MKYFSELFNTPNKDGHSMGFYFKVSPCFYLFSPQPSKHPSLYLDNLKAQVSKRAVLENRRAFGQRPWPSSSKTCSWTRGLSGRRQRWARLSGNRGSELAEQHPGFGEDRTLIPPGCSGRSSLFRTEGSSCCCDAMPEQRPSGIQDFTPQRSQKTFIIVFLF